MKKLLIIGDARHGKDTVAEFLKELFGYTFKSSSVAASEIFLYDALKAKYDYMDPIQCFEDRVNHRQEWHELICEYNKDDKARLAKGILADSDVYVGMRSNAEVEECINQKLFDLIIGVYDPRKDEEHKGSFDINIQEKSDILIPNAGSLEDLKRKVSLIGPLLQMPRHIMVDRFADQMQIELNKNNHKGSIFDWRGVEDKISDLTYHNAKMLLALRTGNKLSVKEYIADSANILLSMGVEGGLYDTPSVATDTCSELEESVFRQVPLNRQKKGQSISHKYKQ